jgi:hypothetical protein
MKFNPIYIENNQSRLEALFMPVTLDSKQRKNILDTTSNTIEEILKNVSSFNTQYKERTGEENIELVKVEGYFRKIKDQFKEVIQKQPYVISKAPEDIPVIISRLVF